MDLQLQDKVVLISGGAKGIGREIVNLFLAEGAHVAVADLRPTNDDDRILWLAGDLTDVAVCQRAVDSTVQKFGRLDVLVNNAGVNDAVGLDHALVSHYTVGTAFLVAFDDGRLIKPGTRGQRRIGEAERIVKRV